MTFKTYEVFISDDIGTTSVDYDSTSGLSAIFNVASDVANKAAYDGFSFDGYELRVTKISDKDYDPKRDTVTLRFIGFESDDGFSDSTYFYVDYE